MANSVLFTCVGTSDPVRGYRDGGMLHIMRHYRPEKIYIFLTEEMGQYEQEGEKCDHRYSKTIQYANDHWDSYEAEAEYVYSHIEDAQDLDIVAGPLYALFDRILQENPESDILINLSSGTPQMKAILNMLAMSSQIRTIKGIQVANPEGKSGNTTRTNEANYDVGLELECNEDETASSPNRCTEPKLFSIERDRTRAQVRKLIEQRDYRALESLGSQLPPTILPLVKHLAARNDLQSDKAQSLSKEVKQTTGFDLYPHKGNLMTAQGQKYAEISEYYLLLRNLEKTNRYSEFILRMNPFLTELLQSILLECLPKEAKSVIAISYDGKVKFRGTVLHDVMPDIAQVIETECRFALDDRDFGMRVGVPLLSKIGQNQVPGFILETFIACERLNSGERNRLAHQLHAVTDQDIETACMDRQGNHYKAHQLVHSFGKMLAYVYPGYCDERLFKIYDECNAYMLKQI